MLVEQPLLQGEVLLRKSRQARQSVVDHRVRIGLNGKKLYTFAYREAQPARGGPRNRAAFGLEAAGARFHDVRLRRDIYYTPDGPLGDAGPVRIPRDATTRRAAGFTNLFPVGEGAGYAGGIMSAALDGARSARALLELGLAR